MPDNLPTLGCVHVSASCNAMDLPHPPTPVETCDTPDRILFRSSVVKIASFRADLRHPQFRGSGPIRDAIFVFPRTSVLLERAGSRPFATSPNIVVFYNQGQEYRRRPIDPAGAVSVYFAPRPDVLLDAVRRVDPAVEARPARPFSFPYGPSEPATYLLQSTLVRHLADAPADGPLAVEEAALHLLDRVLRLAYATTDRQEAVKPAHRDLASRVVELLGRTFRQNRSIEELSTEIGCSPFYLARVFRRVDGRSIHQYLLQIRLNRSLERVAEERDLCSVGLDLGFCSHSHFTFAFHRTFGLTPSRFREQARSSLLRSLLESSIRL